MMVMKEGTRRRRRAGARQKRQRASRKISRAGGDAAFRLSLSYRTPAHSALLRAYRLAAARSCAGAARTASVRIYNIRRCACGGVADAGAGAGAWRVAARAAATYHGARRAARILSWRGVLRVMKKAWRKCARDARASAARLAHISRAVAAREAKRSIIVAAAAAYRETVRRRLCRAAAAWRGVAGWLAGEK